MSSFFQLSAVARSLGTTRDETLDNAPTLAVDPVRRQDERNPIFMSTAQAELPKAAFVARVPERTDYMVRPGGRIDYSPGENPPRSPHVMSPFVPQKQSFGDRPYEPLMEGRTGWRAQR